MNKKDLFDKFLTNSLNDEETQLFNELMESDEVKKEFVAYIIEVREFIVHATELDDSKSPAKKHSKKAPKTYYWPGLLGLAASILFAVWIFWTPTKEKELVLTSGNTYEVNDLKKQNLSLGEVPPLNSELFCKSEAKYTFEDGTWMRFSANSRFSLQSLSPKSITLLEGAVETKVTPQPDSPLVFKTKDGEIKVLGTRFSLSSKTGSSTILQVFEGKVSASNSSSEELVSAGQVAVIDSKKAILKGSDKQLDQLRWQSWRESFINDKDLRLYINFDQGKITNLAQNKFSYAPTLLKGTMAPGRFSDSQALLNGAIDLTNSANYPDQEVLTVFAWININKHSQSAPIITKGDQSWRIQLGDKDNYPHIGHGKDFQNTTASGNLETNKWYFIAGVFNKNDATLYVNGKKAAFLQRTSFKRTKEQKSIRIGGNATAIKRRFLGRIGEVAIIERALSPADIITLYQNTKSASPEVPTNSP